MDEPAPNIYSIECEVECYLCEWKGLFVDLVPSGEYLACPNCLEDADFRIINQND